MKNFYKIIYPLAIWICVIVNHTSANVQSKVRCFEDAMEVDIVRSSPQASIYLEHLKNYPDEACKPKLSDGIATFRLSLRDEGMSRCGLTRVINIATDQKVYYHRIIVEEPADDTSKHAFTVKCVITEVNVLQSKKMYSDNNDDDDDSSMRERDYLSNHRVTSKRRSLPDNFTEPDVITISDVVNGDVPVPILEVRVRQGGTIVTGELNVSPGTPLQMEINLDPKSAPVYGILVTYMQVTDTRTQEETIIFKGCSVDPYLFENFNTIDGDFLNAKFRAFKFPESTYVQFRGTVNVCLDKCDGIECSNGQTGYGRKKRAISSQNGDKNNMFEVTMSTFIKVDFNDGTEMNEELLKFIRTGKNINENNTNREDNDDNNNNKENIGGNDGRIIAKEVRDQFQYSVIKNSSISHNINNSGEIILLLLFLSQLLFQ